MSYRSIFFLLLVLCGSRLLAQPELQPDSMRYNECRQHLDDASESYRVGRIYEIPAMLETCVSLSNNGFTKEDAIKALRLLVLSHAELGDTVLSNVYFRRLLHIYPRYVPAEGVDPLQLVELRNRYKVFSALSIGLYTGTGVVQASPSSYFSVLAGVTDTAALRFPKSINYKKLTNAISQRTDSMGKYSRESGQLVGIQGVLGVFPQWSVLVGAEIGSFSYKFSSNNIVVPIGGDNGGFGSSNSFIIWKYNYSQRLVFTGGRVGIEWRGGKPSWLIQPTLYGGMALNHLLTASREMSRIIVERPYVIGGDTADVVRIDTYSQYRNPLPSWVAAAGARVGRGSIALTANVRVEGYMGNIINSNNRYQNSQLVFQYYHIDDNLYLGYASINIGILYHLSYRVVNNRAYIRNNLRNEELRRR